MTDLKKEIKILEKRYEDLKDRLNVKEADGDLAKLCNLRTEFDETFDQFFDDEELRKKHGDWDEEDCFPMYEKTASDLKLEFDIEDMKKYIEFLKNIIGELEDELA